MSWIEWNKWNVRWWLMTIKMRQEYFRFVHFYVRVARFDSYLLPFNRQAKANHLDANSTFKNVQFFLLLFFVLFCVAFVGRVSFRLGRRLRSFRGVRSSPCRSCVDSNVFLSVSFDRSFDSFSLLSPSSTSSSHSSSSRLACYFSVCRFGRNANNNNDKMWIVVIAFRFASVASVHVSFICNSFACSRAYVLFDQRIGIEHTRSAPKERRRRRRQEKNVKK